ncbi:hypothetical protein AVEN_223784-1 [Araneus ventricosus]|uniref:Uncharacterized protein n=1 Tax=Araneus ventricosus TaxID=182803 RepID=A0A4Y2DM39_ARAVE|nr:hypothetical protein AVEN_223784-1 [Araneus ventricosus]
MVRLRGLFSFFGKRVSTHGLQHKTSQRAAARPRSRPSDKTFLFSSQDNMPPFGDFFRSENCEKEKKLSRPNVRLSSEEISG